MRLGLNFSKILYNWLGRTLLLNFFVASENDAFSWDDMEKLRRSIVVTDFVYIPSLRNQAKEIYNMQVIYEWQRLSVRASMLRRLGKF